MGQETKAGSFGNVRKEKYASVAYWITFYTYTFLIATRYFIYEEGYVSSAFSEKREAFFLGVRKGRERFVFTEKSKGY